MNIQYQSGLSIFHLHVVKPCLSIHSWANFNISFGERFAVLVSKSFPSVFDLNSSGIHCSPNMENFNSGGFHYFHSPFANESIMFIPLAFLVSFARQYAFGIVLINLLFVCMFIHLY